MIPPETNVLYGRHTVFQHKLIRVGETFHGNMLIILLIDLF